MKRGVSAFLSIFLLLSVFGAAFAMADSGSDSGNDDGASVTSSSSASVSDDDENDSDSENKAEVESETETEFETERQDGRMVIKEKIKTRMENGEIRQEMEREVRLISADDRERKIIEFKAKIRSQNGTIRVGNETLMVRELSDDEREIIAGKINAKTGLNLSADDINASASVGAALRAYLSNGNYALVRVMPDTAAEIAVQRLQAKCNVTEKCTVELREFGEGNKTRAVYRIETEKEARTFGIFKSRMKIRAEVDSETGEIVAVKKPWWAFLAAESGDDAQAEVEVEAEAGAQNESANASGTVEEGTIMDGSSSVDASVSTGIADANAGIDANVAL